jgi:hypothetical protein
MQVLCGTNTILKKTSAEKIDWRVNLRAKMRTQDFVNTTRPGRSVWEANSFSASQVLLPLSQELATGPTQPILMNPVPSLTSDSRSNLTLSRDMTEINKSIRYDIIKIFDIDINLAYRYMAW